ncbi:flagellar motor protein MotB [Aquimarina aggregata]|uniref:Flagellar motor protein MotB n=1 Tax=Aquimarina aggregata TaxID=1642818 RepID=A0A162WRF9_9FLAO|nr:OmpA family protein [Aquimarina aggregata]KZS38260.1 flagellar motor protein MotB [Aquimarina aggregata]
MGKRLLKSLLFVIVFLSLGTVFSQEKRLEKAKTQYDRYEYINAQETYLKVAEKGYRSADLFRNLGDSYYFNGQLNEASKWYKELINSYPEDIAPEYYFRYAQTLKANDNYKEADIYLNKFADVNADDQRAKMYKRDPNYLQRIDFQSGRYEIENLEINSSFTDFGTAFYGDNIVFSSSRDTLIFTKSIHQWNNEAFLQLFKAEYDSVNGELSEIEKFGKRINSKFHESTPTFTKDGKTIYFTRNNYIDKKLGKDKRGTNKLKIYRSVKADDGTWSSPEGLPFNSDEYSTAHPTLSVDQQTLYFASDMPGGRGLSDIYKVAINTDGTFGEPENLGERINTEGKETFPFISDNNELYFSSNGQIGLGGLDVYVTHLEPKTKQEGDIINVGKPVNGTKDDFAFIIDYKTKKGFFSSNREGGKGGDDIYGFVELEELRNFCEITIAGTVKDKDTNEFISGAKVTILDSNNTIIETIVVGDDGAYTSTKKIECNTKYFVRAEKDEYVTVEELKDTPNETETLQVPLLLEKKIKSAEIGDDLAKLLSLNKIYFDFDAFYIRTDASVELAKVIEVMKQYPEMKIEVGSHTDSHGDDNYNLRLSEQRAKATVAYMIKNGISVERLTGKGYGETQPVNDCGNDTNCTKDEYQLNRRSEFIIVK